MFTDRAGGAVLVLTACSVRSTNGRSILTSHQGYYAYGPGALRARTGNIPLTDHKFTGQKRDRVPTGRGLMYYNARYGW